MESLLQPSYPGLGHCGHTWARAMWALLSKRSRGFVNYHHGIFCGHHTHLVSHISSVHRVLHDEKEFTSLLHSLEPSRMDKKPGFLVWVDNMPSCVFSCVYVCVLGWLGCTLMWICVDVGLGRQQEDMKLILEKCCDTQNVFAYFVGPCGPKRAHSYRPAWATCPCGPTWVCIGSRLDLLWVHMGP